MNIIESSVLGNSFFIFLNLRVGRLKVCFVLRNFDELYKITGYKEQTSS